MKNFKDRLSDFMDDETHHVTHDLAVHLFGEEVIAKLDQDEPWPAGGCSLANLEEPLFSYAKDGQTPSCLPLDYEEGDYEDQVTTVFTREEDYFAPLDSNGYTLYTPSQRVGGWTIRAIYRSKDEHSFSRDEHSFSMKPTFYEIQHHTCARG